MDERYLTRRDVDKLNQALSDLRQIKFLLGPDRRRRGKFSGEAHPLYQLIRGIVISGTTGDDDYAEVEEAVEFEEDARLPKPEPIKVATHGAVLAEGDAIWAAYHRNYLNIEGTGNPEVDWVLISPAGANAPPLRRFELIEDKNRTDLTAQVRWVDSQGDMYGEPLTIYDPSQAFSGRTRNYYAQGGTGEGTGTPQQDGFQGFALRRLHIDSGTDAGPGTGTGGEPEDEDDGRWTIISMEGFSEFIEVLWRYEEGVGERWELKECYGDQWEWREPADFTGEEGSEIAVGSPVITILDPLEITEAKQEDDTALAFLYDPDTTPPTYLVMTFKQAGGGGDAIIVLLDEDIDPGVEEVDPFEKLDACDDTEDRDKDDDNRLNLWAFYPRRLEVKYYVSGDVGTDDSGTGEGIAYNSKMVLATELEEGEGTGSGSGDTYCYKTRTVYYFDGQPFKIGEYGRADYPDYGENNEWPPPGLPENFLKKRFRAQAKRDAAGKYWLDTSSCQALPPPELLEE